MAAVFTETMARYKKARSYLEPFLNMVLDYEVIGAEKVPKKGDAIVIANHRSDIDPFIVGAAINRYIAWMAASYDFKIPVFGRFLEELGFIPISEEKSDQINAYKDIARAIKAGRLVGIFPEGDSYITNNDFSLRMGTFHPGFARFALKLKTSVLPVTIIGIKEKVEPWAIPRFLREFLGMPDHVLNVKNRLAFKQVKVVITDQVDITPYLAMPPEEASEKLIHDCQKQMLEAIRQHGEIERRQDKDRISGTRIAPGER